MQIVHETYWDGKEVPVFVSKISPIVNGELQRETSVRHDCIVPPDPLICCASMMHDICNSLGFTCYFKPYHLQDEFICL